MQNYAEFSSNALCILAKPCAPLCFAGVFGLMQTPGALAAPVATLPVPVAGFTTPHHAQPPAALSGAPRQIFGLPRVAPAAAAAPPVMTGQGSVHKAGKSAHRTEHPVTRDVYASCMVTIVYLARDATCVD